MTKIKQIIEPPKEQKQYMANENIPMAFSDELDVIKHGMSIHYEEGEISPDLVLFEADEADRKFIRTMHKCAWFIKNYVQDKKIGNRLFSAMITEEVLVAVLKRNRNKNPLLGGVFSRVKDQVQTGMIEGLKEKIFGGNKKEQA